MDETSYSDPRVIAALNEHFVPVRVDNDRHPDVNRRYNMGGWPTTAFLVANGDTIAGATYLPPDQMLESLARVKAFFAANRTALLALETTEQAHAADGAAARAHMGGVSRRRNRLAEDFAGDPGVPGDIPAEIALQVVRAFDPRHGGIGTEPKFPQADVFGFLLAYAGLRDGEGTSGADTHSANSRAKAAGDAEQAAGSDGLLRPARLGDVTRATLTAMAAGGLCDDVGGGFYRYATRRDWTVPHYEKMLEDNARLAALYLQAALLAGSADAGEAGGEATRAGDAAPAGLGDAALYRRTGGAVIDYLLGTLWRGEPPAFAGSQDADEHYYRLDAAGRAGLPEPFVDPTVYIDWNALAARALLRAAPLLERPELTERALRLLEYLLTHARRDGAMPHYIAPQGPPGEGAPLLVDQAAVAAALLDAYEATAERRWLEGAQALAGWAGHHLCAPDGRLHDRLAAPGASPGLLAHPVPALEDNALMAEVLLRLEAYTGTSAYRAQALEILAAWAGSYVAYGVGAAPYGQALLRYLELPDHIVVVGGRGDAAARRLHAAALAAPRPLRTVQLLDPGVPADAERIRSAGYNAAAGGDALAAAAYVCRGRTCLPPVTDPLALAGA
jgi:hypothetical protein